MTVQNRLCSSGLMQWFAEVDDTETGTEGKLRIGYDDCACA